MFRFNKLLLVIIFALFSHIAVAQQLLNKIVAIQANKKPVKEVLKSIGKEGNFYFSYNSNIIREDSLVTINSNNKTVRQLLDLLFDGSIEYKEKDNYIILQRSPGYWYISGYIVDETTGERIENASVYEKNQLVASLTNAQGYFKLKLKDRMQPATLSISKAWYSDTSLSVKPGAEQELTLSIAPKSFALDSIVISPHSGVEDTWLGKFFLSGKQKMQSLNINKFFVEMPYQASVLPGIGTHGKMGGQVTNKISFNIFGGYAAGVEGVEVGGLFNIVKNEAKYTQIAGLFNVTGGRVTGAQIAGLYNHVLDSMDGVQVAGLSNMLLGSAYGAQIAGLYNHVQYDVDGTQIAGLTNYTRLKTDGAQIAGLTNYTGGDADGVQIGGLANLGARNVDGTQIAGLGNIAGKEMNGVQIAGLFNYARKLDGVQIGIINIADTSSGYSIGILNLVRKGYHKLSYSINELTRYNATFKAGNKKLYSILLGGWNGDGANKVVTWGYGMGTEVSLTKHLSINPELTAQYLFLGEWNVNNLMKLQADLTYHITPYLAIYAGPSISLYVAESTIAAEGFRTQIPGNGVRSLYRDETTASWIGGHVGISIF
ncbi:MAG: hypothetical protein EOP56_00560 [Sphingobacteriales bacterium]|nr:MAG: hypothetical protein EOP56_00560 [Sphingobacteriales bacterium]